MLYIFANKNLMLSDLIVYYAKNINSFVFLD